MDPVTLSIMGISALGGLFGNRKHTQESSGTSQSNFDNISRPFFSPEQHGILYPTADAFLANLGKDPNLTGYRANQVGNINRLADVKKRAFEENAASRGVTGPAAATQQNVAESERIGQISQVDQAIPMMIEQLLRDRVNQGIDLFRSLPTGTQSTGFQNTAQQGQMTDPGNMLGGLFGNLAPIMAALYGMGGFDGGGARRDTVQRRI